MQVRRRMARHVGLLSDLYAAGVLVGAPLWGLVADRVGRGRILIVGLVGYEASESSAWGWYWPWRGWR